MSSSFTPRGSAASRSGAKQPRQVGRSGSGRPVPLRYLPERARPARATLSRGRRPNDADVRASRSSGRTARPRPRRSRWPCRSARLQAKFPSDPAPAPQRPARRIPGSARCPWNASPPPAQCPEPRWPAAGPPRRPPRARSGGRGRFTLDRIGRDAAAEAVVDDCVGPRLAEPASACYRDRGDMPAEPVDVATASPWSHGARR